MNDITVILNGYRRPHLLDEQTRAVRDQSVPPAEIMVWVNNGGTCLESFAPALQNPYVTAACNRNLGVWARFAYAMLAQTEFIAIFDDDTIPGRLWFANCLETMREREALLGTRGMIFGGGLDYHHGQQNLGLYGWNEEPAEVDIVGHCWFFKREWLYSAFWRDPPDMRRFARAGEDIHFSYALQKFLGIPTYVPPHPRDRPELWGSTKPEYGGDDVAIFLVDGCSAMDEYFQIVRSKGFKLLCEKKGDLAPHLPSSPDHRSDD